MLKTKQELETHHSVRIFVNKFESKTSIHGLYNNVTMCRQALEESLYIIKKVNSDLSGDKMVKSIEEYQKDAKNFNAPPSQSDNFSMNCFIFVKDKSSDIESVCNDIEKHFDNLSLEVFAIIYYYNYTNVLIINDLLL